jgi:hypothetical protein
MEALQQGPLRDGLGPVRAVAIAGLAIPATNDEPGVRALIRHLGEAADTQGERNAARPIVAQLDAT